MAAPPLRRRATVAISRLRSDPDVQVVRAAPDLLDKGWSLCSARNDKTWSLTDCISFEVMRQMNIREALTGVTTSSRPDSSPC